MGKKEKEYDVICIGQITQDIVVSPVPEDALTREKDTALVDDILIAAGGDAVNEACVLAKLGDSAALLTRLDNTETGEMVHADLVRQGVDTSLLIRPDDCRTFIAIVLIKENGERVFLDGPGKNFYLKPSDIDMSIFEKTRAVSVGSLFALGDLDGDGIAKVLMKAQEAGAFTAADMNFDSEDLGPHGADRAYPYLDYIIPSYKEAVYVTGEKEPEKIADHFLKLGVKNVVLKLGEEGCFFKNGKKHFFTDPYKVTPADTTGCGDNFTAAFVHCLLRGMEDEECAEFACGAGGLNTQGLGAHGNIQSERHVKEFMEKTQKRQVQRRLTELS